jgi:hypothetical protein
MGYVVTIRRASDKPRLTPEEIARLIKSDLALAGGDKEPIVWTSPTDRRRRSINVETDRLWTDDLKGDNDAQVLEMLDKLRSMAAILDARVFGEEGEDITEPSEKIPTASFSFKNGVLAILLLVGLVLISPFVAIWFLVRIFWHFLVKLPVLQRFR